MQTLVALLRAVNVGGTGKLPMTDLRALAEASGFSDVRTYIQSGNLVFSTNEAPLAAKSLLEDRLAEYADKPLGVVIRRTDEMQQTLKINPFPDAEPSKVGVLFLDNPPAADTTETAKGLTDEEIALGRREVFVYFPSGMGRSKLRLTAMSDGTMRNMNTVRKLAGMMASA